MVLKTSGGAPITCTDWDNLAAETGFLALGRNRYHCNYVIYTDGARFYAENGTTGELEFGGPNNIGVSGTQAALVINAAIAALPALGGKIQVKTGLYTLSTPIIIGRGGITFEGVFSSYRDPVTTLTLADGVNDSVIKVDTRAGGITMGIRIANFYINGNSANQTAGHGIYLDGPSTSVIENIEFQSIFQHGICYNGAAGAGYNQNIVINRINTAGGIGGDALHLDGITDSWITNCGLSGAGNAIYTNSGADYIMNNSCYLSNYGIFAGVSSDMSTISENSCHDNTVDGIFFQGDHMIVTDNWCYKNGREGIRTTTHSSIINSNRIEENGEDGLRMEQTTKTTVNDNNIEKNGHYGIMASGCEQVTIQGNNCVNNSQVPGFTYSGIMVVQGVAPSEGVLVNGNVCSDDQGIATQRSGIDININTDGCIFTNNVCNNNNHYGIEIHANANDNLVKNNRLLNNGTAPLRDLGTSTQFATVKGDFPLSNIGGTATTVAPVINTSPGGVDIDANDEFCYVHVPLPKELQLVVRIKLWAYTNVLEADAMRLRVVAHSATDNEAWNGNAIDVPDHPSESTNFAANDVIYWLVDATDDAQIGTLAAQDLVELMAVGEVAGGTDCATDVLFGGYEIEYV